MNSRDALGGALLVVRDLRKSFPSYARGSREADRTLAVDGVSFDIERGQTLGIVGESGCGKTTLAKLLLRLLPPDGGSISFDGQDWLAARGRSLRALRRQVQIIFQDPATSLDPRMRAEDLLAEPLAIHEPRMNRAARRDCVVEMLRAVGMDESALRRYPHEFSGGQRQRLSIARALILRPALVIADEPVASLDVSVGAQVLDLLSRLKHEFHLTLLLISHSLPVVAQMADRVAVMRAGAFVEVGDIDAILRSPQHPYTRELLEAVPALPPFQSLKEQETASGFSANG
jgi:peptide/nickel transport system ATP-binding protein/oligopeptide transport system ATP-binding protein